MARQSPRASDTVVCFVTTPESNARSIAEAVLQGKLAACINIVPVVHSLYWWENKIEQDDESLLVVKTTRVAVSQIDELLRKIHPYQTFELISIDIVGGSHPYLEWIAGSVEPRAGLATRQPDNP